MTQETSISDENLKTILATDRVEMALANVTIPKLYLERFFQAAIDLGGVSESNALKLDIFFTMRTSSYQPSRSNCQNASCPTQGILISRTGSTLTATELANLNAMPAVKNALAIVDVAGCYLLALRDALVISANEVNCAPSSVDALGVSFPLDVSLAITSGNCQGSACPKRGSVKSS